MPFLLLAGMGFSAFFAGCIALIIPFMAVSALSSNTFTVNGQDATRPEFFAASWPLFVAFPILGLAVGGIAYGLWREKPWTREAIMVFWALGAAAMALTQLAAPDTSTGLLGRLASCALCAAVAAWYLYGTDGVRGYYRALADRQPAVSVDGV